jgi:hypothetical protein
LATTITVVGRPAWSTDSRVVYFADSEGGLKKYDVLVGMPESLGFPGDCPVPVGDKHLAFRRIQPKPKTDQNAPPDPVEIVLADLNTREARVLIAEGPATPEPFAASPDGKQLVLLVTEQGQGRNVARASRSVRPGKEGPAPSPWPRGARHSNVGWARDGRGLLLALMPLTSPPDRWDFGARGATEPRSIT